MADPVRAFQAMIRAIERNDPVAVRNGFHPDALIWHNTTQIDQTPEEIVSIVRGLHANFTDVVYELPRVLPTPEGAVGQIILRATAADGERITAHQCMIMSIDADGLITRVDEYLDSAESVRRKADLDRHEG